MNDTDMIGPYIKASAFTQAVIDELGSPEKWCKEALIKLDDEDDPACWDHHEFSALASSAARRAEVRSACLEGAMGLAVGKFAIELDLEHHAFINAVAPAQNDVRHRLGEYMKEQFPEISAGMASTYPHLALYNDHSSMTYEGIRTVLDKTLAYFQEKNL